MVSIETRRKILKDVGLDDFLDEAKEYCLHIESGVCIRFPEGVDLKNRAKEISDKLEKNISGFLDEVRSGIPEGNELEGNCGFLTSVEEDNVIIRFRNLQFEQYGEDVDFLEELFELGNQVSKTIEEYIKDSGIDGIKYEGLVCVEQFWYESYVSIAQISNTQEDGFTRRLILEDDDIWELIEDNELFGIEG